MKFWLKIALLVSLPAFQTIDPVDAQLAEIQRFLAEEEIAVAEQLFDRYTGEYLERRDFLNLAYFIPYAGYLAERKASGTEGLAAAEYWLQLIEEESTSARDHRQAHLEIHTYYLSIGRHQMAYDANKRALEFTYQMPDYRGEEWGMIERNMGVIADLLGSPDLAKMHSLRAHRGFQEDPKTSPVSKFNVLNDMGVRYWYEAQWDSAEYFWLEGIRFLEQMEPTLTNQYYRKAMIEGNLAAVYDVMGNPQESIKRVKASIELIQYFIEHGKDDPKWNRAFLSLFYSTANLAAVYKSVGNYQQALQLHEYTLREKEQRFEPGHPEIIETWIHVGQAHNSLKNFHRAEHYLLQALEALEASEGNFFLQAADASYTLALLYESTNELEKAKEYFLKANDNYYNGLQDKADYVYLGFLGDASRFFSLQGDSEMALSLAQKGLDYVTLVNGKNTVAGFAQVLNMGEVYFNLSDYRKAQAYAAESMEVIQYLVQNSQGSLDSVRVEFDKPRAVLLEVKSAYFLDSVRSVSFLGGSLEKLKAAQAVLDRRKNTLNNSEDIGVLLSQSEELLAFIKQLQLELYEKTGEKAYLEALLTVQEAKVYTKIRTQVNQAGLLSFRGVPDQVLEKEASLKSRLNDEIGESGSLDDFLALSAEWEEFIRMLQLEYPAYYQTKYATIGEAPISLPADLQAVRYIFVRDRLHALVFSSGAMKLMALDFQQELIAQLNESWHDPNLVCRLSHDLYKQLWLPFAEEFPQSSVLIIPDGILFNLSFDMLLTERGDSYEVYSEKSLLAKHDISYHYSLALSQVTSKTSISANYVAFAPGFMDYMKENYRKMVQDTAAIDRSYLSLLPQPFTLNLAQKASGALGGTHYVLDESTPDIFRDRAGNHKIIHVGTHAESNNLSPAFSRLIFAKSEGNALAPEGNAIYAYQIYGMDLRSKLTILTACETGKPVYRPGEGMISLSHAFAYSGSESLLTSLWKIDEKTSTLITAAFLEYLKEGLPKDRALRLAKLDYLKTAQGRTLSPQYWAGLVLIGDSAPIEGLGGRYHWVRWLFGGLLILCLVLLRNRNLIRKEGRKEI